MRKYLEELVDQCQSRYHLQFLFPDHPFILQFQCREETYGISISSRGCTVEEQCEEAHFIIEGEQNHIVSLFSGEDRLSQLIEAGMLSVKAATARCFSLNRSFGSRVPK